MSERFGNPYISSERLNREHPLKFGLGKKSFNTHLSSNMEVKSPRLEKMMSKKSELSPGVHMPNHTMNSGQLESMVGKISAQ